MSTDLLDHVPGAHHAVLLPGPERTSAPEPQSEPEPQPAATTDVLSAPEPARPDEIDLLASPAFAGPSEPAPIAAEPIEPEPMAYPAPPRFVGVEWVNTLFGASIAFSAIGQVLFWGSFFSGIANTAFPDCPPSLPWFVSLALGGVFEAGMVVFADLGMSSRDGKSKAWLGWFLVGVAIAVVCVTINVTHWWSTDFTAALTFGGVGVLGFVAHLAKGLKKSQQHIVACRAVQEENDRRWAAFDAERQRHHEAIEREKQRRHERQMAAREQPDGQPSPGPTEDDTEQTAPTLHAVDSPQKPRTARHKRKRRPSRQEYLATARERFATAPVEAITVGTVVDATGCARSTASGIANELKAERQTA